MTADVRTALHLAAFAIAWLVVFGALMVALACTAPQDHVDPRDCRESENAEVCE